MGVEVNSQGEYRHLIQDKEFYEECTSPESESVHFTDPTVPVRYYVPIDHIGGGFIYNLFCFKETFPVLLEGIITHECYLNVVRTVNEVVVRILRKKKYNVGVGVALFITGSVMFLPIIPLIALDLKRKRKISRAIQQVLNSANHGMPLDSMFWSCRDIFDRGEKIPRICLEVTDIKLITPEKQILFLKEKEKNKHLD